MDDRFRHIAALAAKPSTALSPRASCRHTASSRVDSQQMGAERADRSDRTALPCDRRIVGDVSTLYGGWPRGSCGFRRRRWSCRGKALRARRLRFLGQDVPPPRSHRRYTTTGLVCSTGRTTRRSRTSWWFTGYVASRPSVSSSNRLYSTSGSRRPTTESIARDQVATGRRAAAPHTGYPAGTAGHQRRASVARCARRHRWRESPRALVPRPRSASGNESAGSSKSIPQWRPNHRSRRCVLSRGCGGRGRWSRNARVTSATSNRCPTSNGTDVAQPSLITFTYDDVPRSTGLGNCSTARGIGVGRVTLTLGAIWAYTA